MNDQVPVNTPLVSEEKVVEFMGRSKNRQEWKVRESQMRLKLGDQFDEIWNKVISLSGFAAEMSKKFENHEVPQHEKNSWSSINIAEDSKRIAPL